MLVFHGTTKKGLKSILNNSGIKPNSPWTCSDQDGLMYVYPLNKIVDAHCLEEEEKEDQINEGIRNAFESANIQAAIEAKANTLYVLVMEVDENLLEDDYSCDNMADIASCMNMIDFNSTSIVSVYECQYNIWKTPFVISSLLGNELFNVFSIEDELLKISQYLKDNETYIEDFAEFDYTEANIEDLLEINVIEDSHV